MEPYNGPKSNSGQKAKDLVDMLISTLLRTGVVISLAVVVSGVVLTYIHHPEYRGSSGKLAELLRPGTGFPHSLGAVVHDLAHLDGRAVVIVGLLLLIATPVMRVAVSVVIFIIEKDRRFVIFTLVVLFLLLLSFVLGKAGG